MTLFYNPRTRKVQPWVLMAFILVPLVILVIGWVVTQGMVSEHKIQKANEAAEDIFDKL